MSALSSNDELLIKKLLAHLKAEGYSLRIQQWYSTRVRQLLEYCNSNALEIEAVRSVHVTRFLHRRYRLFHKQHGEVSTPFQKWRHRYTGAINMLLRLVHGRWPIPDPPSTPLEAFHRDLVHDYDAWLRDLRGLRPETRTKRTKHALQFLGWLGSRADKEGLANLTVRDLDAYLKQCCVGFRRTSIEDRAVCLRDFLRHLHRSELTAADLSGTVIGPRIYEHEDIPSALRADEVLRVLEVTREDLSPTGLRDYAILMLLAAYGLRAAEIVRLRLEDLDWRREVLRVRHSKTGTYSELPLLNEPGEALLGYLEKARPPSTHREIFLRILPPHRPFKAGSNLNCVTRARLRAAGITPQGRHGPHAFRHARAVSLLRSGVPLKIIGDVLGHTSAQATAEYLKLATEDLRAVGLELPSGVSPLTHTSLGDAKVIRRFLRAQHFRHPIMPKNYAGTLRNFAGFVSKHGEDAAPTVSIMQLWLKERSLKWPAHILHHRTFLVERYLEWLQEHGVIGSNPFTELHRQYGPRTTPIVRALVCEDSDSALQQLRRLPPFGSFLGKVMEEHVAHMRVLGYRYDTNEGLLLRFDRHLQSHPELTGHPLNEIIDHWSDEQPSPTRLLDARTAGRIVSKAMHRLDPRVPVLPIGEGVARAARQHHRFAHVCTDEEVQRIFQAALAYPSPKAPWRPIWLFTMLMLAYCAGLRGGEIVRLRLGDVDLREETIDIRETKFFKHRRLPLASGVMTALKRYLSLREQAAAPMHPESPLFWSPQHNRTVGGIRLVLTDVLRRAGVKPARGAVGPRLHDLRHSMVGHRMRDWYRSGINPQSRLPYLATYLGHKDIRSTLVYLNITPELLHEASERFRKKGAAAVWATEDRR